MNELQLIKQQADMVIKSVEEIEKVRNEVHEMKEEFQKDIDEIRSTYPLNRGEALLLKHKVDGKTRELTREFFGKFVSKELFCLCWRLLFCAYPLRSPSQVQNIKH